MDKLVLKDLLVLKKSMYWALVYLLAILFIFSMNPPFDKFLYIIAAYGAAYILIMGALMAEYENQTNMLLNSLPVNRYEIILSKYLSALVLALLTLCVTGTLGIVINLLPLPLAIRVMNGVDVGIVLIMVAVTLAIVMPMNLKFGNQAARVTTVMFFMLLFFAPVWAKGYIMDNSQTEWVQALINIAVSQPVVLLAAGAGVGILLLGLSMFVSLRIYEAIDF